MTNILSILPKEYQNIVDILEDKIYDGDNPLTIESIHDKFLVKCDQMNKKSGPKTPT